MERPDGVAPSSHAGNRARPMDGPHLSLLLLAGRTASANARLWALSALRGCPCGEDPFRAVSQWLDSNRSQIEPIQSRSQG